jgi:hypothetical protein
MDLGNVTPIFVLRGCSFVALRMPVENVWTLDIMPNPGVHEASVSACFDDRVVEFPLIVAPPLEWYLQTRTGGEEWNWLDYYVYIANALVKSE